MLCSFYRFHSWIQRVDEEVTFVNSEFELMSRIKECTHLENYTRVIVTGVSYTGKSTFLDRLHSSMDTYKPCKYPDFELIHEDEFLLLKYHHIIDRWYPWDRYVYSDILPEIRSNYGFKIKVVIFIRNKFKVHDKDVRYKIDEKSKYIELAEMLDKSPVIDEVIVLTDKIQSPTLVI